MAERICTIDGCERPHRARGMCGRHYNDWHRALNGQTTYQRTCVVCSAVWTTRRADAKFCSDSCKGAHYAATRRTKCVLSADHPVRVEIARQREEREQLQRRASASKRAADAAARIEWRTPRECRGCGSVFCPLYTPTQLDCSRKCARRVGKRSRRGREHGAFGTFVWSDFMRVAARFGYACAYCGRTSNQQLDPDHVVPLSRGGLNSISNLLPSCRDCNSSKGARTLDEWAAWIAERNMTPRATTWAPEDRRYHHLVTVRATEVA